MEIDKLQDVSPDEFGARADALIEVSRVHRSSYNHLLCPPGNKGTSLFFSKIKFLADI